MSDEKIKCERETFGYLTRVDLPLVVFELLAKRILSKEAFVLYCVLRNHMKEEYKNTTYTRLSKECRTKPVNIWLSLQDLKCTRSELGGKSLIRINYDMEPETIVMCKVD